MPPADRDLLSSVCHDLKAPLASIVMGAGFLRRVLPPGEAASLRVAEAIHRAAERMNQVISNFADLARLESHDLALDVATADVVAVAKAAHDRFAPEAAGQGVPLSFEVDPALPSMRLPCDAERLGQSLRLLAWSALRVVPDGGSISVRVAAGTKDEPVRFEVEAKPRPEPGSRRIGAEPPRPEMAIARGLIELHGARLSVTGGGDTMLFAFSLPRAGPAPRESPAPT